jgi:hypothetical protein
MKTLDDLEASGDLQISVRATSLKRYHDLFTSNSINKEEYQDLCKQVLDIESIDKSTLTEQRMRQLEDGINILRALVAVV